MKEETKLRDISFKEVIKVLKDPLRVFVQEGTFAYISTYCDGVIEVIEEVKVNRVILNLLMSLAKDEVIYKSKCENIKSDIIGKAVFYDIWRHDAYETQSDEAYDVAFSLNLAVER